MRNKLLLLGMCCLVGVALATTALAQKIEDPNEKYWDPKPAGTFVDITEVEPNGTIATATPAACGDIAHGTITTGGTAGDLDYFGPFALTAGTLFGALTDADGTPSVGDTYIVLYNAAGTQVAYDDDSSPNGAYSLLNFTIATAGNYYLMVRSYSASYTGAYKCTFSCSAPQPPPVNDTCAGAIDIPCGQINLSGTTLNAVNDYDPLSTGCTGYAAAGKDVVYKFLVGPGAVIDISYTTAADGSVYIVSNCADMASCLIGMDDTVSGQAEVINYTFAAGGTYYLILDSYGLNTSGAWTLTGSLSGCPVPTSTTTWGAVKNIYR